MQERRLLRLVNRCLHFCYQTTRDGFIEGPIALAFNRGHWCPYCRINIDALACAEKEIAGEHRHIAAIVPDRQRFARGSNPMLRHRFRFSRIWTTDMRRPLACRFTLGTS